jgi:hypothetical protein
MKLHQYLKEEILKLREQALYCADEESDPDEAKYWAEQAALLLTFVEEHA